MKKTKIILLLVVFFAFNSCDRVIQGVIDEFNSERPTKKEAKNKDAKEELLKQTLS